MKNYYKTLGISQNSTKEEIKKAFRELAFKYHPDKNTNQVSAEKFKEINEAKQVLLDDFKKFQYDGSLDRYLSKNKVDPVFKDLKRKKVYRRNIPLDLVKETVLNKFFLSILFIITILLTIAFYQVPEEEPALDTPLIAKAVSEIKAEPLEAKPVADTSFVREKAIEKETIKVAAGKASFETKPKMRASYRAKRVVKKQWFSHKIKKVKHHAPIAKQRVKKNNKIHTLSPASKTKGDKALMKQLTYKKMMEVLEQVRAEKQKAGGNTNCVQIMKSTSSNISNAFKLADFLKGYGFVISGRGKIPASSNGITVDSMNNCITITVGTL